MWELPAWHCSRALPEGLTSGRGSVLPALLCLFPSHTEPSGPLSTDPPALASWPPVCGAHLHAERRRPEGFGGPSRAACPYVATCRLLLQFAPCVVASLPGSCPERSPRWKVFTWLSSSARRRYGCGAGAGTEGPIFPAAVRLCREPVFPAPPGELSLRRARLFCFLLGKAPVCITWLLSSLAFPSNFE